MSLTGEKRQELRKARDEQARTRARVEAAIDRAQKRIGRDFATPAGYQPEPRSGGRPGRPPGSGDGISRRQSEVLALLAEGLDNKEVAAALTISLETVKAHMRRVLFQLEAKNRTHAVAIALRRGYIQ